MARRHLVLMVFGYLAAGAACALARGPFRVGMWGGWATAGLSGAVTIGLLSWTLRGPPLALVKAISLGFLVRLLFLVAGLFLTVKGAGGAPIGFGAGFFAVYLPLQAWEILAFGPRSRSEART